MYFYKRFFDSEGDIDKQIGRIGATSMNLYGLSQVSELLKEFNINNTIIKQKDDRPNTNQKYRLRIHDKNSIVLFYKCIGFTIKRKQQILENIIHNKGWLVSKRQR